MKRNDEKMIRDFNESGQRFETETLDTKDEYKLHVYFFEHASIALVWNGYVIYTDPLMEYSDYARLPKADIILVTHEHYDHLDKDAIKSLRKPETVIVGSRNVVSEVPDAVLLLHGEKKEIFPGIAVKAVPAYNISLEQLQFHPKERGDNGYIITLGETNVYISGDTEPIPEMAHLGNIDVMFLSVNQPYTMKPAQAAQAARMIGAPVFFPFHTTDTDMDLLRQEMKADTNISLRIHHMP